VDDKHGILPKCEVKKKKYLIGVQFNVIIW
jgi:hypothetical protein